MKNVYVLKKYSRIENLSGLDTECVVLGVYSTEEAANAADDMEDEQDDEWTEVVTVCFYE